MALTDASLPKTKGRAGASKGAPARKGRSCPKVPAVAPSDRLDPATVKARLLKAGRVVTSVHKDRNLIVTEFPDGSIRKGLTTDTS